MLQASLQTRARVIPPSTWTSRVPQPKASRGRNSAATPSDAGVEITVKRGETIFDEGDDAVFLYKLVKGSVRLGRVMAGGCRQICDFLLPGDLLGFATGEIHEFSAEAIEDCTLIRYRRSAMASLISTDSAFACELQRLTATGLHGAYEHMVRLCHRSARDRIAWFLLAMARRSVTGDTIHLPMSRSDIADYLGMAHETTSRVFTQLKKSGAIAELSVNRIKLLNRQALEA